MEIRFSALVFTFLFFADQFTKITINLFTALPRFINPICNSQIAWNIPLKPTLFYPLWIAILFYLAKLLTQEKKLRNKMALVLILAGGLSNMLDRIHYGCVVDFIDLKLFPVFNLADIYISAGIILLITNKLINSKSQALNPK